MNQPTINNLATWVAILTNLRGSRYRNEDGNIDYRCTQWHLYTYYMYTFLHIQSDACAGSCTCHMQCVSLSIHSVESAACVMCELVPMFLIYICIDMCSWLCTVVCSLFRLLPTAVPSLMRLCCLIPSKSWVFLQKNQLCLLSCSTQCFEVYHSCGTHAQGWRHVSALHPTSTPWNAPELSVAMSRRLCIVASKYWPWRFRGIYLQMNVVFVCICKVSFGVIAAARNEMRTENGKP